jgi:hypothetical protein
MQTYPVKKKRRSYVISVLGHAHKVLAEMNMYTHAVRSTLIADMGDCDEFGFTLPLIAMGFDPEPFGIAHVYNRMPYINPESISQNIRTSVAQGWLMVDRAGVFRATDKTRRYHASLCQCVDKAYTQMMSLPNVQLTWVNDLLQRVIEAITENKGLNFKPFFELDIKLAAFQSSLQQKVCSKLSHLLAYRDDTYVNAWMDQEVNGYVWDAFSCIYKENARTIESISKLLGPSRHYTADVYELAIEELISRGWIQSVNGKYEPTNQGLQVLANVVFTMNRYFFAPWGCLDDMEIRCLSDQLETFVNTLKIDPQKQDNERLNLSHNFVLGSAQWAGI